MKAKELMIRDWAQSPDLMRPAQYSGRFLDFQPLDGEKYRRLEFLYEDGNNGMHIPEKRVYPVPFTEEIFEKNEFKKHTFNGTIIYSKKSLVDIDWYDVDVEIGKDAEGIQRWDCVCLKIQKAGANLTLYNQSCFHQLQHALRLVGLDEMADNLKA